MIRKSLWNVFVSELFSEDWTNGKQEHLQPSSDETSKAIDKTCSSNEWHIKAHCPNFRNSKVLFEDHKPLFLNAFKFCLDVLCMSLSFIKDLESVPSQQFIKCHFSDKDTEAEQGLWLRFWGSALNLI